MKTDMKPACNNGRGPDVITPANNGRVEVYFRREDDPPEEYDYSVSHRYMRGWRVFFLFVPMAVCLVLLALLLMGS